MSVVETGQRGVLITGAARRIGAAMARATSVSTSAWQARSPGTMAQVPPSALISAARLAASSSDWW